MPKLYLKQTFEEPAMGAMGAGPSTTFHWRIDRTYPDGKSKVGSWVANYYFEVATGGTDRQTLGNARRALAARARHEGKQCSFEYVEE